MLQWFLDNRDDITFWIALFGFLMSLLTWIFNLWNHRVRIEILPDKDRRGFSIGDTELINCAVDGRNQAIELRLPCVYINHSTIPISITQIILYADNGRTYRVETTPQFAVHNFRPMIDSDSVYERFLETTQFPLNLGALQAECSPILFLLPHGVRLVDAEIVTNRKAIWNKSLSTFIQSLLDEKYKVSDNRDERQN